MAKKDHYFEGTEAEMNAFCANFKTRPKVKETEDGVFRIKVATTLKIKAPKIGKASTKAKFEKPEKVKKVKK